MRKRLVQWTRIWSVVLLLSTVPVVALSEPSPAPPEGASKPAQTSRKEPPKAAEKAPSPPPAAAAKAPKSKTKGRAPPAAAGSGPAPAPKPKTAAPTSSSAGGAPPSVAPPQGRSPSETHVLRLRDLESRVDELKERIRRSHARLSLLSESLLSGGLGGSRADIVFHNEMSNAFRIRRILVVLDGAVQYKKQDDTDELSRQKEIPVFSGPIPPGDHTLQVVVGMQGHGYGIFSYLKAFKPQVKHTRSFTVEEGRAIRIEITAWEKGSSTTPLEQRPSLRLTEKVTDRREAELLEGE